MPIWGRALICCVAFLACALAAAQKTTIRMMAGPSQGIPPKEDTNPRSLARRAVFEEFHRQNPDVEVVNAGGLELKGDMQESGFLMSMAGDTAPDVFYVNFRQYYNYIDQGFCRPLDDLVAKNPEALERLNPIVGKVLRSYDGKLYAIPWFQVAMALYYRRDHFAEAGLDPNRPPSDWDEFLAYGRRLTESKEGRNGFAFSNGMGSRGYHWVDFVWQAGGEVVEPAEGGFWRSTIDTPQVATALDFYRRLVAETWTGKDGKSHGPVAAVSPTYSQDILDGKVSMWLGYTGDVVMNMADLNPSLIGVAALPAGPDGHANEINAGMWAINASVTDPKKLDACWRFIRYFAGDEAAKINTQRFVEMGMGNLVIPTWLRRFGYKDQLATIDPGWVRANDEVFKSGHPEPYGRNCQQAYLVLDEALDRAVLEPDTPARSILHDVARQMDRKLLGYTPPDVLARQRGWATGILGAFFLTLAWWGIAAWRRAARFAMPPDVPSGGYPPSDDGSASVHPGRDGTSASAPAIFPLPRRGKSVEGLPRPDGGDLGAPPNQTTSTPVRSRSQALPLGTGGGGSARTHRRAARFVALCMAPAAASLIVWAYYPLLRGLIIAFQDYRIVKGSRWVGVDNFVTAFTSPIFYRSLLNSFLYVALSLVIGFFLPIFLAIALNEIPRFKVFFRTVFYLPAMTSPIVIAFLWRQFYDRSESGILNSILAPIADALNAIQPWWHVEKSHDWLGSTHLAMFAVVLPGIWAGAGPGSILYLAALKNIPAERYEAADLDGASWWGKIWRVMLPGLRPLILINLLGVFIAGFKAMDSVFVLTGGGPLYSTHTIGLEVWTSAFLFLKFGYATAAAWVMGAILVGFTLMQIKSLLRLRFRAAGL
ncbi:MAG: extracellular solute-binding protein [Fimbriimonas ginsengisoli]|uniref:Extracellular solute-binding protein n=1 Tax=Fimbriimonas ginsengisoli TaxID=1005039 RepID=A0A931LXU1_FIMGI|nr:extracellular solute-binding protein [Fimbriimonas ginsengisoli]